MAHSAASLDRSFVRHARGVFRPETLRALRRYLAEIEAERNAAPATEREKQAVTRGEGSDALRLDTRWFEAWRDPPPALLELIGPYTLISYPCQVRHIRRDCGQHVPWHQDAAFIRLLGKRAHTRVATCFVPLDEDPGERTGLAFGPPEAELRPHLPLDGFGAGIADYAAEETRFELAQGDCLFFGDLAPHRTVTPSGSQVERASLEFRLIEPADAIADKDYFDVTRGAFLRRDEP